MAALSSIAMGGLALAGGIAGAKGKKSVTENEQTSQLEVSPMGAQEALAQGVASGSLGQLQGLVGQGPGTQDVTAGLGAQRDLASMLQQYAQGGFMPGESDFQAAQKFAQGAFAGQQESLNQQFADQQTEARRLAAQLNRPVNDPILQAKLAQQQMRSQQQLAADQRGVATQFAQQLPGQRLDFAQQRAGVLQGLASQALSNRSNLLSLGSQLQGQQQQFRLATGKQVQTNTQTSKSGGGLMGAISGALGGASAGAGVANLFGAAGSQSIGSLLGLGGGGGASGLQMPGLSGGMQAAPGPSLGGFRSFSGANPFQSQGLSMPAMSINATPGLGASRLSQGAPYQRNIYSGIGGAKFGL